MPNRARVVEMLTTDKVGTHAWRNLPGAEAHLCENAPDCGLPRDNAAARRKIAETAAEMDALYVRIMDEIDWNRVMEIARSRHRMALDAMEDGEPIVHVQTADLYGIEVPCGECICEAVLSVEFYAFHWKYGPSDKSPRARTAAEMEDL